MHIETIRVAVVLYLEDAPSTLVSHTVMDADGAVKKLKTYRTPSG